jgi:hypothetical protein
MRALAADCGLGPASVVRAVREGVDLGALDVVHAGRGTRSTRYRFDHVALRCYTETLTTGEKVGIAFPDRNAFGTLEPPALPQGNGSVSTQKQLQDRELRLGTHASGTLEADDDEAQRFAHPADDPEQPDARATALAQWRGALDGTEAEVPRPPDPAPPLTPAQARYAESLTPPEEVASHVAGVRHAMRGGRL